MDLAAELAEAKGQKDGPGLWEPADGGWIIHDWLDFNPTAQEVAIDRAAAAERMRRLRASRKDGSDERSRERSEEVPQPRPVPSRSPSQPNREDSKPFAGAASLPLPTQNSLVSQVGPDAQDEKPGCPAKPDAAGAAKPSRDVANRTAAMLLGELSAARKRVNPRAAPIRPLECHLREIRARLLEGVAPDEIRHVIQVCEARAKTNAEAAKYFDAVSPFRSRNIGMWLAKSVEEAGTETTRAGGMPQPQRWGADDLLARKTRIPQPGDKEPDDE